MKKRILIIIDPWELDWINILLFPLSAHYAVLRNIKRFVESRNDIDTIVIAAYDNKKASSIVCNLKGKKIYATTIDEIKFLLDDDTVDGIFLAGMAWNMCVRNRELGYLNLSKFSGNKDLLVKNDCVIYSGEYDSKYFDPLENPEWLPVEKNVYKYTMGV